MKLLGYDLCDPLDIFHVTWYEKDIYHSEIVTILSTITFLAEILNVVGQFKLTNFFFLYFRQEVVRSGRMLNMDPKKKCIMMGTPIGLSIFYFDK